MNLPFPTVTALGPNHVLLPAKPIFDDIMAVIDQADTAYERDGIFAVSIPRRNDNIWLKKLRRAYKPDDGGIMLHPVLMRPLEEPTAETITLLGRTLPVFNVEFSDGPYSDRDVKIHGRVVGLWAGDPVAA